jgi:hypothetical protein
MTNSGDAQSGEMTIGSSGDRAAHYRERAEKFRRMAETSASRSDRERLTGMADQYEQLADSLEPPRHQ